MNNKNLLIGVGVAVVVYYFYNKKQKEKLQSTPYTDAELDKVVADYVNQLIKSSQPFISNEKIDVEKAKNSILALIKRAYSNGKDVSRRNIDRILVILGKRERIIVGDKSLTLTPEEMSVLNSFQCQILSNEEELAGIKKWQECKKQHNIGGIIDPSKMTKEEIINATLENERNAQKYGELCRSYLVKPHC
jgi:hypothetical protein